MNVVEFLKDKKYMILLFSIVALVSIITLGCIFLPEIFYDNWIWKYYWGPLVADATGTQVVIHNGVEAYAGYTLVSEITYGLFFITALFLIYKLLKKFEVAIDWKFALALMPYIIVGPVSRVLEDTYYFDPPIVYWFITPLIYIQITLIGVFFILIGSYFSRIYKEKSIKSFLKYFLSFIVLIDILYTIIWLLNLKYGRYIINPGIIFILSFISFTPVLYRIYKKREITINLVLFCGGILLLLPQLYLIGIWILGEQWSYTAGVRFDVFILITILVGIITGVVYFVSYMFQSVKNIEVYRMPLNLAMIVGHMIDGITSYVSIYDPLNMGLIGYIEKHPASNFVMQIWPPLFPIVKLLLIIIVIYVFDIFYREEMKNNLNMVNLLKIGILLLGFSPGLRDLLRVTMGV